MKYCPINITNLSERIPEKHLTLKDLTARLDNDAQDLLEKLSLSQKN
jgi:hypothetical protein